MCEFIRFISELLRKSIWSKCLIMFAVVVAAMIFYQLPVHSFDRSGFSKLIQMMPSDGPPERYGNVALRNRSTKKGMSPVIFPHWSHRDKYTCTVCHVDIGFSMIRGGSEITRGDNLAGRFCGACHDGKTAFTVRYEKTKHCDRCHLKDVKVLDKKFRSFAKDLPKTRYGNKIDWVKALESGLIKPRKSFYSDEEFLELPENLKKPLRLQTISERSTAIFSHEKHVAWLDCSGCHPDIFNIKKKGTESFSMDKNLYGWFCGTCHLRVSFPLTDCSRCHPNIRSGASGPRF